MLQWFIALVLFLAESICDLRQKKIWWPFCLAAGILGILLSWKESVTISMLLFRMIPGFLLLLTGKLTSEGIGYGDGVMILTGGILLGATTICRILLLGLLFSAIWSLLLVIVFHKRKEEGIPFVPFLTAAMLCEWVLLL